MKVTGTMFNRTVGVVAGKPRGPKGDKGDPGTAATVAVGTVTTGAPGTDAAVTNSGTSSAAVLDLTIPEGQAGAPGAPGGGAQQGLVKLGAVFSQAPNTEEVDIPGMTLTYTAPATPRPLEAIVRGCVQHQNGTDANRAAGLLLYEGATKIGTITTIFAGQFPAAGGYHSIDGGLRFTPTAGPHTYKLRAILNVSTVGTINWQVGIPALNFPDFVFTIDEH